MAASGLILYSGLDRGQASLGKRTEDGAAEYKEEGD